MSALHECVTLCCIPNWEIHKITVWNMHACVISIELLDYTCRAMQDTAWSDLKLKDINNFEIIGNIIGNLYVHRPNREIVLSDVKIPRFYCISNILCTFFRLQLFSPWLQVYLHSSNFPKLQTTLDIMTTCNWLQLQISPCVTYIYITKGHKLRYDKWNIQSAFIEPTCVQGNKCFV